MPINSIFFTCQDGGELLFYFSLAILDLGIRLRLGHGRGICIVDAFLLVCVLALNRLISNFN